MANLTAPDGKTTVQQITVNGDPYDLPPWIDEALFREGIGSGDPENPFSTLTSSVLSYWRTGYGGYDDPQEPVFELIFKVPFGSIQELVLEYFTPVRRLEGASTTLVAEDGYVRVGFAAAEYMDFNDVQLAVFPKELPREFSSEPRLEDIYQELKRDFEGTVKNAVGWDGIYEEFAVAGVPYFALLMVHED